MRCDARGVASRGVAATGPSDKTTSLARLERRFARSCWNSAGSPAINTAARFTYRSPAGASWRSCWSRDLIDLPIRHGRRPAILQHSLNHSHHFVLYGCRMENEKTIALTADEPFATIEPKILYFGTPVALISSVNEDGSANLAPMSSYWALGWTLLLGISLQTQ